MITEYYISSSITSVVSAEVVSTIISELQQHESVKITNLDEPPNQTAGKIYDTLITDAPNSPVCFYLILNIEQLRPGNDFTVEVMREISSLLNMKNPDNKLITVLTPFNCEQTNLAMYPLMVEAAQRCVVSDRVMFVDPKNQEYFKDLLELGEVTPELLSVISNSTLTSAPAASSTQKPKVNMNFQYDEREILLAACALIKKENLRFSQTDDTGTILTADGNVFIADGATSTVAHALVIGMSEGTDSAGLKFIENAIESILKLDATKHRLIFPINIISLRHFSVAELSIDADKSQNKPVIAPLVRLEIIESLLETDYIDQILKVIYPLLQRYCSKGKTLQIAPTVICPRKQLDGTSCGIIAAKNMERAALKQGFDFGDAYNAAQTKELRIEQIEAVGDETFTARQFEDHKDPKLSAPMQQNDCEKLHDLLTRYLQTLDDAARDSIYNLALVFVICELNLLRISVNRQKINLVMAKLSRAQELLRDRHDPELSFALDDLNDAIASDKSKLYSEKIKIWCGSNEAKLRSDEYGCLLDDFFELKRDTADDQLVWTQDGRYTFYCVLEMYFKLHLISAAESMEASSEGEATLSFVSVSGRNAQYTGTVDDDNQASGLGVWVTPVERYIGVFDKNHKGDLGIDCDQSIKELDVFTYWRGRRSDAGEFLDGNISCLVGGAIAECNPEAFVLLKGEIVDGEVSDYGTLTVCYSQHASDQPYFMHVKFANNKIVRILETNLPQDGVLERKIMDHFARHQQELHLSLDKNQEAQQTEERSLLLREQLDMHVEDGKPESPCPGFFPSWKRPKLEVEADGNPGAELGEKSGDEVAMRYRHE